MNFFAAAWRTWGAKAIILGIALIILTPLPLALSGTGGNPIGLGLLAGAGIVFGFCVLLAGCIALSVELIVSNSYGVSLRSFGCVAFGFIVFVLCYAFVGRYLAALRGESLGGLSRAEAFAQQIGITHTPKGFTYSDFEQSQTKQSFQLHDSASSGWLLITIEPAGDSTDHESCASAVRAEAITTRTLGYTVGNDRHKVTDGSEQELRFNAAHRRYSVLTRSLDPVDTMVGTYEWKQPGTRGVAPSILLDVAQQLCTGAASWKTASSSGN